MGPGSDRTPCYPCNSCQEPPGCSWSSKVSGMGRSGVESLLECLQVGRTHLGNALRKLAQSNWRWLWAHDLDRCDHSSSWGLSLAIRAVWHQNTCMHRHRLACTLHKGDVHDYVLPQVCVSLSARPSALTSKLYQTMASVS